MTADTESHDVVVVVDGRRTNDPQNNDNGTPPEDKKAAIATAKTAETAVVAGESTLVSGETISQPESAAKWYRKLNPLRWQKIPPVPAERAAVTEEYGANIFSIITFRWMSPLMKVCVCHTS